jgi:expansin
MKTRAIVMIFAAILPAACGSDGGDGGGGGPGPALGEPVSGQFHLGPVEWEGSFWNSCAPYPAEIQALEGDLLAGLGTDYNGEGRLCDACILVETEAGESATLRVVTTGATNEPGDIDVSAAAYDLLDSGEYPRAMTWQLVACPDTGTVRYQFQTGASVDWTSFWVRNQKLPLEKVEVRSVRHADWFELRRGTDGTFNDDGGFGDGEFTLRLTAINGDTLEDAFPGFAAGDLLDSATGQFP